MTDTTRPNLVLDRHGVLFDTNGTLVLATSRPHVSAHQSGGSDAIKLDDLAAPDDNTDLNVTTAKHGLAPKAPNDTAKFLRGDAAWAIADHWTEVVKSSHQDVGTSTLTADTQLKIAGVAAGQIYDIRLYLLYAATDATTDFKFNFTFPGVGSWHRYIGLADAADALLLSTGIQTVGDTWAADVVAGTGSGLTDVRTVLVEMQVLTDDAGDIQFKFAENTNDVGKVARCVAGSVLRYRRLL